MDLDKIKIGVLGGGISPEREISLKSAKEVLSSLKRSNLNTVFIDIRTSSPEEVSELIRNYEVDFAFIALHGEFGEDGSIQKILDQLNIGYTGSGPTPSFSAMDKRVSKKIFSKNKVPTPNYIVWSKRGDLSLNIKYPVVVKPHFSGSSLGISIVNSENHLKKAIDLACSIKGDAIIEEYVEGKEVTVGILDNEPLAVVEIVPKNKYFDFDAKYSEEKSDFVVPAKLENFIYKNIQEVALKAHKALGCRYFSRVDIRLSNDNIPYVLEVNSIPGLTSHSLLPLSAKPLGLDFDQLVLKMMELAIYEKKETEKV